MFFNVRLTQLGFSRGLNVIIQASSVCCSMLHLCMIYISNNKLISPLAIQNAQHPVASVLQRWAIVAFILHDGIRIFGSLVRVDKQSVGVLPGWAILSTSALMEKILIMLWHYTGFKHHICLFLFIWGINRNTIFGGSLFCSLTWGQHEQITSQIVSVSDYLKRIMG